jgi:hypothetical protein
MPGYGIAGPDEGSRLLPWSWAEERLASSHDYWVATVWPSDGRPHVMPVWGVWDGEALLFSTSLRSRKARNLAADARCTIATDNALEPVVLEGSAEVVTEVEDLAAFAAAINAKYGVDYGVDFYDPAVNATYRVRPGRAFGLVEADFAGSPTRWLFPDP